jgi:dTDP-4-dehydrorhamnose 3,5-epimerase
LRFIETPLAGAFLIDPERIEDERGFFARAWCEEELRARGLDAHVAQCNLSFNRRKGTLRGMHYRPAPHGEVKIVRCTRGGVFDVIVDLREQSATRWQWFGVELTAENRRALYVPQELAHGFITLADDCELFYLMGQPHAAAAGRGVRWDDPAIDIQWPLVPAVISQSDRNWPLLSVESVSS